MYLMMIILWTIALVILITNGKSVSNRWIAATAFIGGFTGLGSLIGDVLIPDVFINYIKNPETISTMESIYRMIFSISCYFYFPYIMFALTYCKVKLFNNSRIRKIAPFILFIPLITLDLLYPLDSYYKPKTILSAVFSIGYVTSANILLLTDYWKEVSPKLKREKLLMILTLAPVTTLSAIFGNLMHYLGYHSMWKQELWLFLYLAIVFFFFVVKWGIFGIRIIFQDTEFHNTMNIINTGVLTIDHALKNETLKIQACVENLESAGIDEDDEAKWNIKIIQNSVGHLKDIADKVKQRVRQVEICRKPVNLGEIIQNALDRVDVFRKQKNITISYICKYNMTVMCDPALIEEVLVNIFTNSIEAMGTGGTLSIQITNRNAVYILKITDNGSGIPGELIPRVFDPFFSTKDPVTNYGLGLSYCYNVLRDHGWNIELESKIGEGTTVYITIPQIGILNKAV